MKNRFIFSIIFSFLTLYFNVNANSIARQSVNFRPVNGLEAKENTLEEEGQREILIKKSETRKVEISNYDKNFYKPSEKNLYILLGYNNQIYTKTSSELFGQNATLNFATPIVDKRFGGEVFFGGKFGENRDLLFEVGIDYNFAYLDFKKPVITMENRSIEAAGIHTINPSFRFAYNFFTIDDFAFYGGLSTGFSILYFAFGDESKVKYSFQYGTIAGISYSLSESFELLLSHKFFYNPKKTFIIQDKKYITGFTGHNLNLGVKIKF
jgi:hypothetical protein